MIKTLRLENFKNFQNATLQIGSFTVLIGANASGKSNLRDAFRFLHGIGRGYSLAEIIGEKYQGGQSIWSGIRGGTREIASSGSNSFALEAEFRLSAQRVNPPGTWPIKYKIEARVDEALDKKPLSDRRGASDRFPRIDKEYLIAAQKYGFNVRDKIDKNSVKVEFRRERGNQGPHPPAKAYLSGNPVLFQVAEDDEGKSKLARAFSRAVLQELESFRFLDLSPTQMRVPSLPGQTTLGDRGENLSSVLSAICDDGLKKEALLEWVRKLTPMDVDDLLFQPDAAGRILLILKERDGRTISAMSASDGTLRFLAILAMLLGPTPASFYFIEELENGIHPTRLSLLVDLIENQAKQRKIQVVATSHSPLLLQFLSEESLANASIVYRLPAHTSSQIRRVLDVPEARRVIKEQSVSLLHASNWFEDSLNLNEVEEEPESIEASSTT